MTEREKLINKSMYIARVLENLDEYLSEESKENLKEELDKISEEINNIEDKKETRE